MAITKDQIFQVEKNTAAWVRVVLATAAGVPATGKTGSDLTIANRWRCDGTSGVTAMAPAAGDLVEKDAAGAPGEYDFQLQADDTNFDGEGEFYVAEAGGAFFRGKVLCVEKTCSDRVLDNATSIAAIPSAVTIAVAVWEKLISTHKGVVGSAAEFVNRIVAALAGDRQHNADGTYTHTDDSGATVDSGVTYDATDTPSRVGVVKRIAD